MTPAKTIALLNELRVLRRAAAKVQEYQPGKVRAAIDFQNRADRHHPTRLVINETATAVIREVLTTDEMRTRMAARIAARIAAIEAKLPAGVVDGG
jgi:hypothetical protein